MLTDSQWGPGQSDMSLVHMRQNPGIRRPGVLSCVTQYRCKLNESRVLVKSLCHFQKRGNQGRTLRSHSRFRSFWSQVSSTGSSKSSLPSAWVRRVVVLRIAAADDVIPEVRAHLRRPSRFPITRFCVSPSPSVTTAYPLGAERHTSDPASPPRLEARF